MAGRPGAPPDGIPGRSGRWVARRRAARPSVARRPAGRADGVALAAAGAWPSGPAATSLGAGASGVASGVAAAGVWPGGPAAAGLGAGSWPGGVMPGGGGWQEWLTVAAALGFQPDPGAWPDGVNVGAAASAASSEACLDDRRPSAPVGSASAWRRGGRAPRPPPPPASAPPPASEHIDLTDDRAEADWCDENLRIVCEIFAEEVQKGNRANTHLNKAGYKNVIASFKQRTGLDYTRIQFKNRWDKLKVDYGIWKQLKNYETGMGWDETKKNIAMPESWWKKTAKAIKGCTRFKHRGLQNEDKLEIMFEDIRNTGDDHWSASSGLLPSSANRSRESSPFGEEEEEANNDDDSDTEDVTPTTSSRGRKGRGAGNDKRKKPKTSTGHWFQEQMGKLVEMNERVTASCESVARREDKSGCSIKDVMALVKNVVLLRQQMSISLHR